MIYDNIRVLVLCMAVGRSIVFAESTMASELRASASCPIHWQVGVLNARLAR